MLRVKRWCRPRTVDDGMKRSLRKSAIASLLGLGVSSLMVLSSLYLLGCKKASLLWVLEPGLRLCALEEPIVLWISPSLYSAKIWTWAIISNATAFCTLC